jgi:ATP-binding cassette subfamily B protein
MHGLWTVLFDFWPTTITFAVSLTLFYGASEELGQFLVCWITVYIVVAIALAGRARTLSREFAAARSMVSGKVVDAMTNMMNIKMFARRDFERAYIRDALNVEVSKAQRTYWYMEIMRWFQFLATFALLVGLILLSIEQLASGQLTEGDFAMVFSLSLLIINSARNLSREFLQFFEYVGHISDGLGIIIRAHEIVDVEKAKPLKVKKGEIKFSRVGFSHDGETDIFKNLNLTIKPGQKVGLVGPSGAGKSTLVNILLRLYDIQKGSIKLDGQDIAKHTQDSLREQVAMIPQEPMLFHRSLMENIRYGRIDATDKEVIAASKKAFCHEFIMEQPKGYDALVGERGIKLSGGQRQRIAIARAILKDAPILVLDEATSSLDSASEKYIQKSLDHLMKDRTVLVIAHRLSTIAHMDRVIVMDAGKIVEDGSHDELLQIPDGLYAKLWGMQAGGFLPE